MNYQAAKVFILNKLKQDLPEDLTYHGIHHTFDVLNAAKELCRMESISIYESLLVKTAALFHDSGFTLQRKNHEEISCQIAARHLPDFQYSKKEIERVCGMIMATKIPQSPKNHLEKIICDADLDYLGREDFESISISLLKELKTAKVLETEEAWNLIQVDFIRNHRFFTNTNKKRRSPKSQEHLERLKYLYL